MNQPQLYSKYNGLQKADALFVIDNYLDLITWKSNENILDVGCGDGDVMLKFLLPQLPEKFNKLVGVDLSEEMVQFARKMCDDDSRIAFEQLDISATSLPPGFHGGFDHVFSFFCLHWVLEQRQAVRNMFDMLKPGGEMLLTFLANNPIYDIYESMAKSAKWSRYMENVNQYIAPYHHSENPEKDLENLLSEEGFTSRLCTTEDRSYTFPNNSILLKSIKAVNPFVSKVPEKDMDAYIEDCWNEVRKLDCVTIESYNDNNNKEEKIQVPYKLFVVFASKPL